MSKRGRNNQVLLDIAKSVYTQWQKSDGFILHCTEEQQIVFHEFARFLQTSPKYRSGNSFDLANNYPFVKLHGEWFLSIPKAYLFFFQNRHLIASFPDSEGMQILFKAVQNASKYADAVKELDNKLSPKYYDNSEDYAQQMRELYEQHMIEQLRLFD